jgi:hypothetical protein
MSWIFSPDSQVNNTAPVPSPGLRIQNAVQGIPIPLLLAGQQRFAGNLIYYNDFKATSQDNSPSGSGKGSVGGGGGGKGATSSNVTYTYSAAFIMALCEGPVSGILSVWNNKTNQTLGDLNLVAFVGTTTQTAWGYVVAAHPADARAYRGIAYAAAGPFEMGNTDQLPNLSFEVIAVNANVIAGLPDGDVSQAVADLFISAYFGVGFPASRWADQTDWSNYSRAAGMVVSPILNSQTDAASIARDMIEYTNCDARWSSGLLKIVPRAAGVISGNGYRYDPNLTPIYDFTVNDFLPNQGSMGTKGSGTVPLVVSRTPQVDMINNVKVEYLDRTNSYNPVAIERKDEAAIIAFRERPSSSKSLHFFCDANAAGMAASLRLIRERIARTYQWTAGRRFILLDCTDLVTVTDPSRNIVRQLVRITEIQEAPDRTLIFTAEEWPGTAQPPLYGHQASSGYVPNLNADPGGINDPIIFEPTDALGGGLQIWGGISGQDKTLWGGADIFASYDNINYQRVGRVLGPARAGALTSLLLNVAINPTGQTIDAANVLKVDLSASGGTLSSGTQLDATSLNTMSYVDGEVIAYQTATLTGPNAYSLTYLVRGAFDTPIGGHAIGTQFLRLDNSVFKVPFDQTRIGSTIYLKFQSFNIWGGGAPQLADLNPYTYVIQGTALASPLPNVTDLRTVFVDGFTNLDWTEVTDFRQVRYEIRLGAAWDSALSLGTVAHPPFVVPGLGTYWVSAVSQPAAGLIVYSEVPQSVTIAGAMLVQNVVAIWDEKATGWSGSFTGGSGIDVSLNAIRTGGSGDVLTQTDFLNITDILTMGGNQNGTYEIPSTHVIDAGFTVNAAVSVKWLPTGVPVGQDILGVGDFLGMPDVLGSASTRFIDVFPEIRVGDFVGDLYADGDLYEQFDLYRDTTWSAWQRFTPGVYRGRFFDFRMQLQTIDPQTIAYALEFSFTVDVPDRVDTFTNLTVLAAGNTVTFQPNGAASPAPFTGGPNGATVPLIQITILDEQSGDRASITGETLAQCTVQIINAGVGVQRRVNLTAQGY